MKAAFILFLNLFFVGFGLLPLWVYAIFVYTQSLKPNAGADYTSGAAIWLVIAWIPWCAITLGIAGIVCMASVGLVLEASGTRRRRLGRAVACLALLTLLSAVSASLLWKWHTARAVRFDDEREAGRVYVEQHPKVAGLITGKISVEPTGMVAGRAGADYPRASMAARDSTTVRYVYQIYPWGHFNSESAVYAVVDVSQGFFTRIFNLACLVPWDEFNRRTAVPRTDPCRSEAVRN
jgi:hypothetical protein